MTSIGPALLPVSQFLSRGVSSSGAVDPTQYHSLDEAARGMEGAFLSILLKEMRQTLEPGTMFGKDGGDAFGGLFDQMMAQHLTQGDGIGLARLIKQQVETKTPHDATHPASPGRSPAQAGLPLSGPPAP